MNFILTTDPTIVAKRSDIIEEPVTIRVKEFNAASAQIFSEEISEAHNTGQEVIPVIIDSPGGHVYSLLSMISDIRNSKLPVATIGVGKSMSCGSILLACGSPGYRYIDSFSHLMIHDIASGTWGKIEEMQADVKQSVRLQKQIFSMMSENCGHDKNYFTSKIHEKSHAEWYLNAREAKRESIVDYIGMPTMRVEVAVTHSFGIEK